MPAWHSRQPSVLSARASLLSSTCAFFLAGKKGRTAPVRVSHMVVWTGYTVDMKAGATGPLSRAALLSNLHSYERSNTESCMNERASKGLPVYVIADRCGKG